MREFTFGDQATSVRRKLTVAVRPRFTAGFTFTAIASLGACGGTPPGTSEAEPGAFFQVAVIVDMTSDPVSLETVDEVLGFAHAKLVDLTGFGLQRVGYVEDRSGRSMDVIATDYMKAHRGSLPNGIIIFSVGDDDRARLNRAYARQIRAPLGFHNSFVSPYFGDDHMYMAILQFHYHYAACGYVGAETVQSPVSIGGECRAEVGTTCVPWNSMQVCQNALDILDGSTPIDLPAGPIVHEFMHAFGGGGANDHYGTPTCNEAMGKPVDYFDLDESEHFNNMCPPVYGAFVDSYQP